MKLFFFSNALMFGLIIVCGANAPHLDAGYDETRKIAKKARGEGEAWSELRRPGDAHLNWKGAEVEVWKNEVKAPVIPQKNVVSEAGGLNGKWDKDVLGKPIYEGLVTSPKVPEERWSKVELPNYSQDSTSTKGIAGVTRSRLDPGWNEGGIGDWTEMEPGPGHVDGIAEQPPREWDQGLTTWQATTVEEKDRPIRNV